MGIVALKDMGYSINTWTGDGSVAQYNKVEFLKRYLKASVNFKKNDEFFEMYKRGKGQLLVDLGSGRYSGGAEIAEMIGAKGYIAVDHCERHLNVLEDELKSSPIDCAVCHCDLLTFVEEFFEKYPRSISIIASDITQTHIDEKKLRDANNFIPNVIHPQGFFMSYLSEFTPNLRLYDSKLRTEDAKLYLKD